MIRRSSMLVASGFALLPVALWGLGLGRHTGEDGRVAGAEGRPQAGPNVALPPGSPVRTDPRMSSADVGLPCSVFEGRVVSAASGVGVGNAELVFSLSGEATAVSAEADGTFRFEPPLCGHWLLAVATARGYLPFAPEWGHSTLLFDVLPGAKVSGIVVTLEPEVEYRGVVVDPTGRRVSGADVRLVTAAAADTALVPIRDHFVSDAAGEFSFVAPDDAMLEAHHSAFAPGRARIDFATRVSRRLVLALHELDQSPETSGSIAGRVMLAGDQPVGGALVVIQPESDDVLGGGQAISDPDGRFEIKDLAPGAYRVVASQAGSGEAVARNVPSGTSGLRLQLWEGGRIAGCVRDRRTGQPVATFMVAVRPRGHGWRLLRSVSVVDPSGCYEMDGLAPGPSGVVVAAPGYARSEEVQTTVPQPADAPAAADFALSRGGRIRGFVVDRRTRLPLPGATVELGDELLPAVSALPVRTSAWVGEDGAFEIMAVPGRPFSLLASAPGHHGRVLGGLEVADGESSGPVTIELMAVAGDEQPHVEVVDIGAVLSPIGTAVVVENVAAGSGAAEAGLEPDDEIVSIDGRPVAELGPAAAKSLILGAQDGSVVLGVRKAGDPSHAEQGIVVHRWMMQR